MGKNILIIEDEENLVELLKYRLEANGFSVDTTLDGEDGLKKIKSGKPDLVILDIKMPKMHGYDVCKQAKENKATKHIPVIMLSAYTQVDDQDRASKCGANSFLTKPFDPDELLKEIGKYLNK